MSDLKELNDETNNLDELVSRSLKEKRVKLLGLIDNEATIKTTRGKADNIDIMVSKRFRDRRVMLGLSQQDVAKIIDVSIQQVQKYEKGTNRISSGKLFAIARILKVPITYFYEQDNNSEAGVNTFVEDDNIPSEKEIINLIKAFNLIKSLQSRKKITELIQAVS